MHSDYTSMMSCFTYELCFDFRSFIQHGNTSIYMRNTTWRDLIPEEQAQEDFHTGQILP